MRLRGVDVVTAQEDGAPRLPDSDLLLRASALGRIVFTHDIGFLALAESWQRESKVFVGLVFGHPLRVTIGGVVSDLELIGHASEPEEWQSRIERLPF